jgi:hypothetical protein
LIICPASRGFFLYNTLLFNKMSTTFTWSVATLDRTVADGIVGTVHYTVSAADDVYSSGAYGSVGLEAPAEGDTVIPYADLTEAGVIEWVKTALGGEEKVTEIEAALQTQLDEQRTPTKASGKPWS